MTEPPLLDVRDLEVTYRRRGHEVRAVRGVSFDLRAGEILGLVGESGCGKSSLARALAGLEPPSAGTVALRGKACPPPGRARARAIQMVFQDPAGSLNPRQTVGAALAEVLTVHGLAKRQDTAGAVAALLERVELDAVLGARYPHELSGGQRQRVGLARALAVSPDLILADEPVSALDVSVQVQVLNLLRTLRERDGVSFLFIAHDLAAVNYVCDRTLVMYAGRIVEAAAGDALWRAPAHPYTELLRRAVPEPTLEANGPHRHPVLDPLGRDASSRLTGTVRPTQPGLFTNVNNPGQESEGEGRARRPRRAAEDERTAIEDLDACQIELKSDPESVVRPTSPDAYCPFHPRCPRATAACREREPGLSEVAPGRFSACFHADAQLRDAQDDA